MAIRVHNDLDLAGLKLTNADIVIPPRSTPPSNPQKGSLWYEDGTGLLYSFDGGTWRTSAGGLPEISIREISTSGGVTEGLASDHLVVLTGALAHGYNLPKTTIPRGGVLVREITVKNRSTGYVTLGVSSGDTLDGGSTIMLTPNQSVSVVNNGTDWVVI